MKSNSRSFNVFLIVLTAVLVSTQLTSAHAADFGFLPYAWFNMEIANKLINQETASTSAQGASKNVIQLSPGRRNEDLQAQSEAHDCRDQRSLLVLKDLRRNRRTT